MLPGTQNRYPGTEPRYQVIKPVPGTELRYLGTEPGIKEFNLGNQEPGVIEATRDPNLSMQGPNLGNKGPHLGTQGQTLEETIGTKEP